MKQCWIQYIKKIPKNPPVKKSNYLDKNLLWVFLDGAVAHHIALHALHVRHTEADDQSSTKFEEIAMIRIDSEYAMCTDVWLAAQVSWGIFKEIDAR